MFYYDDYDSPVGRITIACDETCIVGLWFENQKYYMDVTEGQSCRQAQTMLLDRAKAWLDRYFRGQQPKIRELPLRFIGTDFRKKVWQILTEIPYGQVTTYKEIARKLSPSMSAQAVGGAVGRNPISVIVPCHRVVGTDGSLTGYAGGMEIKTALLSLEGVKGYGGQTL